MEIRAENLGYTYNPGTPLEVRALEDVTFHVPLGSAMGILGGTGSGKTTLIKHLNGLLVATEGSLLLDGRDARSYGPGLGRRVGVVFQRPERQLFEETIFDDVSFVLRRFTSLSEAEILQRVQEVCALLGLNLDRVGHRSPFVLTDGEKRKAAIAGILVNEPEVLVLDEPAVGLDPPAMGELLQVLGQMKASKKRTLVIVSHDMEPFLPLLDCLLLLHRGRVAGFGSPAEVCDRVGDDELMRDFLPVVALLVRDLRRAGLPIPANDYRIPALLDQLAAAPGDTRRSF